MAQAVVAGSQRRRAGDLRALVSDGGVVLVSVVLAVVELTLQVVVLGLELVVIFLRDLLGGGSPSASRGKGGVGALESGVDAQDRLNGALVVEVLVSCGMPRGRSG